MPYSPLCSRRSAGVAILLGLAATAVVVAQSDPAGLVSYDEKFIIGVKNYAMKKWSDAIIHLG